MPVHINGIIAGMHRSKRSNCSRELYAFHFFPLDPDIRDSFGVGYCSPVLFCVTVSNYILLSFPGICYRQSPGILPAG